MLAMVRDHLEALETAGFSPGTIANRDGVLRRFETSVGGDLLTCTVHDAERWWLELGPLADTTRAVYLTHVRSFYRWVTARDLRPDDPTRRILMPRRTQYLPRPVPHGQALALLEELDPVDQVAVALMFGCGLRCGEVALADREHYDGERLWIFGKGKRMRAVPVPARLAALIEDCGPGPLVPGRDGRRMTREKVSERYCRLLRRHHVYATAHQLRHTFGTEAYRRMRDLRAVGTLMGHGSPITTAGYAAVDVTDAGALLADLL